MLLTTVAETIRRHRMFGSGQRVGAAVSGGADSVCLLHALLELAPEWDLRLVVLHLNHCLRGKESRRDEQFVRELADRLGVPAIVRAVDVAAIHDNLEQAARRARLDFFHEQISAGTVDRVATGHTANDQAETTLFRFLRGAGGAGIAGVRPVTTGGLARPLLEITRAEVETYLRARKIAWREDSSNTDLRFARNRIRRRLLPQLAAEWNPAIVETLRRAADWAWVEEQYWQEETRRLAGQLLEERHGAVLVRAEALRQLPLAAARRLVRRAVEIAKGDMTGLGFDHIAAILRISAPGLGHGRAQVPGVEVERSLDWVRFGPSREAHKSFNGYNLLVSVPDILQIPGSATAISLELVENPETNGGQKSVYNGETGWVDWRMVSGSLEIRNWRPGDRYQPAGSASEEKIKTLFQEARIPRWERRHWPVLTDGCAIVWAARFGVAAPFAANPTSTMLLRIREKKTPLEFGIGDSSSGV